MCVCGVMESVVSVECVRVWSEGVCVCVCVCVCVWRDGVCVCVE